MLILSQGYKYPGREREPGQRSTDKLSFLGALTSFTFPLSLHTWFSPPAAAFLPVLLAVVIRVLNAR